MPGSNNSDDNSSQSWDRLSTVSQPLNGLPLTPQPLHTGWLEPYRSVLGQSLWHTAHLACAFLLWYHFRLRTCCATLTFCRRSSSSVPYRRRLSPSARSFQGRRSSAVSSFHAAPAALWKSPLGPPAKQVDLGWMEVCVASAKNIYRLCSWPSSRATIIDRKRWPCFCCCARLLLFPRHRCSPSPLLPPPLRRLRPPPAAERGSAACGWWPPEQ
jgi:hypothetical protein